jgi:hypothetical protein
MTLQLPRFGSISGNRLFLPINITAKSLSIPSNDEERKNNVQATSRGKTEESALIIQIPQGFRLESELSTVALKSDFGAFDLKVSMDNKGQIVVNRRLVLNNSVQPKEKYGDFIDFLKAIVKADKSKLVLVKGT